MSPDSSGYSFQIRMAACHGSSESLTCLPPPPSHESQIKNLGVCNDEKTRKEESEGNKGMEVPS